MLNKCTFLSPGDSDFFGSVKTVQFKAGEREKTFPVIARDDVTPEVCTCMSPK